ncbi:MAG: iron ABC transporter permease [bacterium]
MPALARGQTWLLVPPALLLVALFAVPMALVLGAARDPAAWAWAGDSYARDTLVLTIEQATLSTVLTLAIAVPLAWFYHTRRVPMGRLQLALHAAPFVMPVFVVVYGLQTVLGPRGWLGVDVLSATGHVIHAPFAWLPATLGHLPGLRGIPDWPAALGPILVAHAYYNYGFAARMLHAALDRRPHRLEDAARTLGANRRSVLRRITMPLLMPSLGAVALLVFLFCFASFGTVLLMGGSQVRTLETVIFSKVNALFPDMGEAAVLGVIQLALNGLLLAGYLMLRRRMRRIPAEVPRQARPAGPVATALSWLLVAAALTPILAVLVGGFQVNGHWSLQPWRHLLSGPNGFDVAAALRLSLFYAVGGTLLALASCACLAYGSRGLGAWGRRTVEAVASVPMASSSALVGLGFMLAYGPGTWLPFAYTVWIVLAAHVILILPFAARAILPAFESHDQRLDEAAQLLGARPAAVARRIHWPILRKPILVALGFCIALSLGDFGASTILSSTGTRGLAVWANTSLGSAFDPVARASSMALAGLLGVLAAAAYVLVERAGRRAEDPL